MSKMQLSYLSKIGGIGGSLKELPEDFIVEEIMKDGRILEIDQKVEGVDKEGRFVHFVLQKRDWSTADAIKTIAKKIGISFRRFNTAGTKDKRSISTQLVSVFGIEKEKLMKIRIRDIRINGVWTATDKVMIGALLGNRFTIRINGVSGDAEEKVMDIYKDLDKRFPNYFGEQRFGTTRSNTHIVGELLVKGQFEDAVMNYLTDSTSEKNEEARVARKELAETRDFSTALKTFPRYLRMERSLLVHLVVHPNDYVNALRRLPRNILLLFIHAFQSHIFNIILSERISNGELKPAEGEYFCGENAYGFPDSSKRTEKGWLCMKIIGYESKLSEREKQLLEQFGISKDDFKLKSIPEISSKGTFRTAFAPLKDFSFTKDTFRFSLPSGCYATVALREFLDDKNV